MLNGVLLLSVLAVTISLTPTNTESRKTSASRDICRSRCACEERENLLNINCENKEFTTVGQLQAPPNKISQLFLNGNFLSRLAANEFVNYGNVTSLHLGNNGLQEIRTGAFNGLRFLKRLHLNNNNLEVIKEDMFAGLESLEYLQADYNYISAIEPGAFSKLNKLKVLILNDNLLLSLPANVFRFVLLTHLDLRGNRLKMLPFAGVLEHIGGIMEIQLEENPWNCTCDLIPLKAWLDTISVFVGDIVCETPFRLHGKDVTQLIKQDLCPRRNAGERVPPHHHHHPPNDSHHYTGVVVGAASTLHPGAAVPTRSPKASRPPKMRHRPTPRITSKDKHVFGPIMVYQTRSPVPVLCPNVCVCTSQNPDSGLNVNCQERKLNNITELNPKPSYPKKLHLTGNYLQIIYRADLAEYSSLELLHLGNNRIAVIQEGAFENLTNLRRLYLNGNYIESLSRSLFVGLQSLQYLYLEYNVIKEILPQTFNALHNLQLLFLNNNLLRSLPDQVFGGTMLTRLNLRNNHFSYLPVHGVLDQLSAFIQIDLQENPWDCTCHIVALKNWMELSSTSVVVNEITCDSPSKHAGRLLRSLRNDAICPEPPGDEDAGGGGGGPPPQRRPPTKQPTVPSPAGGAAHPSTSSPSSAPTSSSSSSSSSTLPTSSSTTSPSSSLSSSPSSSSSSPAAPSLSLGPSAVAPPTTESRILSPPELHPEVPLSVLILGLLVVFILSVCLGAGLFVFVLKRRKGAEHVLPGGGANNLDLSSFQVQYGSYAAEPTHVHADKSAEGHVYNYIPPPVGSMCQNPIYMQKDHREQVAFYRNLKELSFGPLDPKKDELLGGRSPGGAYTISAMDFMDKSPAATPPCAVAPAPPEHPPPELLYQNFTERPSREILPAAAGAPPSYNYSFCTLPKRPCVVPPYEAVVASARRHVAATANSGVGQDRPLNKAALYGTPRKYYGTEQPSSKSNEHPLLLPGKLKAEPDYLEVLEKQTAVSQL